MCAVCYVLYVCCMSCALCAVCRVLCVLCAFVAWVLCFAVNYESVYMRHCKQNTLADTLLADWGDEEIQEDELPSNKAEDKDEKKTEQDALMKDVKGSILCVLSVLCVCLHGS